MILIASIATAAAWSYDCPFIWQFRPATSYNLFRGQEGMASIFQSGNRWLDDQLKAFESCMHPFCPSSCSSEISLQRTWKNNRCEGTTNRQSTGYIEVLLAYFSSSRHAIQHRKAYVFCGQLDGAMLSCHLCMDSWLLWKHSLALNHSAPLPWVQSTEIVVWRREFIVMAIERLPAILSKDDTRD